MNDSVDGGGGRDDGGVGVSYSHPDLLTTNTAAT